MAAGTIDGIPATRTQFGEAEGLPDPQYIGVWSICKTCETFPTQDEALDAIQDTQDYRNFDGNPADCYAVPAIYYIVSQLVKSALPDREDLLVPAEVVRDEQGHIIGCRSLGR